LFQQRVVEMGGDLCVVVPPRHGSGGCGQVQEDSWMFALLRRFAPDWIAVFLRTNFIFSASDGKKLGEFNRKLSFRDSYVLDMTADPQRTIDRRIAVAMGVLLDTGERR
jgi:hypothetical protein